MAPVSGTCVMCGVIKISLYFRVESQHSDNYGTFIIRTDSVT